MFEEKREKNEKPTNKQILFRKGIKPINAISSDEGSDIFSDIDKSEALIKKRQDDEIKVEVIDEPIKDIKEEKEVIQIEVPEIKPKNEKKAKKKKKKKKRNEIEELYKLGDEDKQESVGVLSKPVFIDKHERQPIIKPKQKSHSDKLKRLKRENKYMLVKAHKVNEIVINDDKTETLPDDDDTVNQDIEYRKWKIRELTRIHKANLERNKFENLKTETERRKNMTEEDRKLEDKRIGKYKKNMKSDYKYMQKYYSSFAFFQDQDEEVYKRDYNVAVGYDNFDKSLLPQRMQVRAGEFGKKGKSKYKDLFTEDTGRYDPDYVPDEAVMRKMRNKQGGYKRSDRL